MPVQGTGKFNFRGQFYVIKLIKQRFLFLTDN